MAFVFMIDPNTENIGIYKEPIETGDFDDPDSDRNAPLNNPLDNLQYLIWHIQLDNMEVVIEQEATVNHPEMPIGSSSIGGSGEGSSLSSNIDYSYTPIDYTLFAHNLGYEPIIYVSDGTKIIPPGYVLQRAGSGGTAVRYVSFYVDSTNVYLREHGTKGGSALPAISKTYNVMVIGHQSPSEGNVPVILKDFNPTTGVLKLGDGRFSSEKRYLQVVPGGTPFGLALGKTMDFNNGAPRFVDVDGNIFDPIPDDVLVRIYVGSQTKSADASSPSNYGGSFSGSETLRVQAP